MSDEDPYFDDYNGVLHNKHGITDADELRMVEEDLALARIEELIVNPLNGDFGEQHLHAIHEYILQDTYDFAGKTRLEKIWDPEKYEEVLNMASVNYPKCYSDYPGEDLQSKLHEVFANLKLDNNLKNLNAGQFVDRLARYSTEIWQAHPYREGNTRTTVEFVRQLSKEAGHELAGDFPQNKKQFRNSLALATVGEATGLFEQLTVAVLPFDKAELELHDRVERLVNDELDDKSIDYKGGMRDTAKPEYIEAALQDVKVAKSVVMAKIEEQLPFHKKRVDLQSSLARERSVFSKGVFLNKERLRLTLALEAAARNAASKEEINSLKAQLRDVDRDIHVHTLIKPGLSSDRTLEMLQVANDQMEGMTYGDFPWSKLARPVERFGTGEIDHSSEHASASWYISSERKMITRHVENDLLRRSQSIEPTSASKEFNSKILMESEKRTFAIRKAVFDTNPEKVNQVKELKAEYKVRSYYSELETLEQKSNRLLTQMESPSMSQVRANDGRMQYLTKKLETDLTLATKLSAREQEKVQRVKTAVRERHSLQVERGVER